MANNIRGITVEIGGNTTKLGKAIEDVEKKSRTLSSELTDINKLLKFEPGNVDLLTQKQGVLASQIEATAKKLDTLKEAEKDVQAQFERGEVSEEQVRALQREIISTTSKMEMYEKASKETAEQIEKLGNESDGVKDDFKNTKKGADDASEALDDMSDSAKDAGDSAEGLGSKLGGALKGGLGALAGAVTAIGGAMVTSAEETREYRTNMGKLETAFDSAGHSAENATKTYESLQGILGESDQAVEASNHLAKLCDNEKDLEKWTKIATGVYAEFGDSLPIESLTEASNETAKTGALTGALADSLNWAGVNEEKFQAKLDKCSNEQERQALITETLSGLYDKSAEAYKKNNEEVIRANQANESLTQSMADIGASVEPLLTDIKSLGASLLSDLVPGISQVATAFRGVLNGDAGATAQLGTALSGLITGLLTKIVELLPTIASVGMSLITTLATTIISSLPQLLSTGVQIIITLINGLTSAIPLIINSITSIIPQLVGVLTSSIPLLIQGAISLFMALCMAIPQILPPLISALPVIITTIVNSLLTAIPQIIQGALLLLMGIIDAIPLLIQLLVPMIPEIVYTVVLGLLDCIPILLDASVELLLAIVKAIPLIIVELVKAVPKIVDTIINYMKQLPGKLWTILKSVVKNYVKWVTEVRQTAKDGFIKVRDAVITVAKQLPSKIKSAIWSAISTITTWGSNMLSKAKSAMSKVVSGITSTLKSIPGKIKSIGGDVVRGIWNGISDKVGWIKSKISGFKDQVLKQLKSVFKIKSPSRLMRDEVGNYLAEGISVGLTESSAPKDAINQVKEDMLNGVNEINGVTLNRQLETTFKGSISPNDNLSAKLDTIIEKLKLGSQIVLDTGTLVGETVDAYDRALSSRKTQLARGWS